MVGPARAVQLIREAGGLDPHYESGGWISESDPSLEAP
jgi:hypothetical protein